MGFWRRGLHTLLILAACLCLGSCARVPPGVSSANGTLLTFNFNFAQAINPSYIYVVAIRVLNPPAVSGNQLTSEPEYGPSPVVAVGSQNGVVGGWPTHYVIYTEATPNLYQVYRFPLTSQIPNPSDPGAPINLIWPGIYVADVIPGSGVDPRPVGGGSYGSQLGFTIPLSDLSQYTTSQNPITQIQFNILSMNVSALTQAQINERVMDAIGNQSSIANQTFSNFVTVSTQYGNTYTDSNTGVLETSNDTYSVNGNYLPSVDLVSPWSLTVATQ